MCKNEDLIKPAPSPINSLSGGESLNGFSADSFTETDAFELEMMTAKLPMKQPWSKHEDATLLKLVMKYGAANWDILAKCMKSRSGKQCRERYHNILDPTVRKGNWTHQEDQKILELHASVGNQWAKISRELCGRTDNSVKNRFYAISKRTDFIVPFKGSALYASSAGKGEGPAAPANGGLAGMVIVPGYSVKSVVRDPPPTSIATTHNETFVASFFQSKSFPPPL